MSDGAGPAEPLRFAQVSDVAAELLRTEGESGRFEFKRTAKALDQSVLVAAANWVALDPERSKVTILVGVDEDLDPTSGLTRGKPVGLPGDLSLQVRRIQDHARTTLPVPVDLRIIEEGVETATPFLRVEVRPTFPPHFDSSGRRVTRYGASHRSLMDEELLAIYLAREASQFQARFQAIAQGTVDAIAALQGQVEGLADTVERLPDLIDGAEAAAYSAGSEAEDVRSDVRLLIGRIDALESGVARHLNRTPLNVLLRLRHVRRRVWRAFNVDHVLKPTKAAEALAPKMLAHLNAPMSYEPFLVNLLALEHWEKALDERNRPASMRWWTGQLKEAKGLDESHVGLNLRDDVAAVEALFEKATKWSQIELKPWSPDEL